MKTSSLILVVLMSLAACSKADKALHSAPAIEATTSNMNVRMTRMDDKMGTLQQTMQTMFEQFRTKESEETRSRKWNEILSEKNAIGRKLESACVFYQAFEFQFWTNNQTFDNTFKLDLMLKDAANELTQVMLDLYNSINAKKLDPTVEGVSHNNELAFYALAATMHFNNNYQIENRSGEKQFPLTSLYDIVTQALTKEYNREPLKEHERILVAGMNHEMMIDLLKARVDFISAVALANMTDKKQMSMGQLLKAGIFKLSGGRFGSISLPQTMDKRANPDPTREQVIAILDEAVATKRFLKTIGVEKKLQKTIRSAFANLPIRTEDAEKDAKNFTIKSQVDELLKD